MVKNPITLCPQTEGFKDPLITFANDLDQDKDSHIFFVGPHMRSKLFDIQITHQQKF